MQSFLFLVLYACWWSTSSLYVIYVIRSTISTICMSWLTVNCVCCSSRVQFVWWRLSSLLSMTPLLCVLYLCRRLTTLLYGILRVSSNIRMQVTDFSTVCHLPDLECYTYADDWTQCCMKIFLSLILCLCWWLNVVCIHNFLMLYLYQWLISMLYLILLVLNTMLMPMIKSRMES